MNTAEKLNQSVKLVECPRDAMQGWKAFIPTEEKIKYLNALLQVGFHTLDCGSFVSPKIIPQMADTRAVLSRLELANTATRLLVIIANTRGAIEAADFDQITYLGFPFSISQTFQQRNANSSIEESLVRVEEIQEICMRKGKQLVVYISMAFGNPYGDAYSEEIVYEWTNKIQALGISTISLADTVGLASPEQVNTISNYLVKALPHVEIGVHLHSSAQNRQAKVEAALKAGCLRFDGALKGIGGCPMANDELVGNLDSEWLIAYLKQQHLLPALNEGALAESIRLAEEIFGLPHSESIH